MAYLKHDLMGPQGDAAIMVFNPGAEATLTIDLSMLPNDLFGDGASNQAVVPYDLLTNASGPPLASSWTVDMGAKEMKFFSGFGLGAFAPRQGKKGACVADDRYRRHFMGTLQACFLECCADARCENVLVDYVELWWMEAPPSMSCTLLGKIADPATACQEGQGTLVKSLPSGRRCAERWAEVGEVAPAAPGVPAAHLATTPECAGVVI